MNEFTSLTFTAKSDERSRWVQFRGEFPGYRDETKRSGGIESVWFVLTDTELASLVSGHVGSFTDGYVQLKVCGDRWTFIDNEALDYSRGATRGSVQMRYARANFPVAVVALLARWACQAWAKQAGIRTAKKADGMYVSDTAAELDLMPHVARWTARYGHGKGRARIAAAPETLERIEASRGKGNFDARIAQLETMARNGTCAVDQTGDLPMWRDGRGFTWRAAGLFGGLVNHASEGETPAWSLHT